LQNDECVHKIKKIVHLIEDDYEILLYFDFYILLVDILLVDHWPYLTIYTQQEIKRTCNKTTQVIIYFRKNPPISIPEKQNKLNGNY